MNVDDHNDKSFGLQLDSEIEARLEPPADLPEGLRYVADTRRQSINPAQPSNRRPSNTSRRLSNSDTENTRCNVRTRGYLPIENYGIIGNMRTIAMCGTDGSIDFCCYPKFDSPSIFCRMLDKDKGGHFSISPRQHTSNKQQYLPNGNILTTRFLSDEGVGQITDYMHLPEQSQRHGTKPLLPWIIRVVEVIRGTVSFDMECYPAFNYARDEHTVELVSCGQTNGNDEANAPKLYPEDDISYYVGSGRAIFKSSTMNVDLRYLVKCGDFACPAVNLKVDEKAVNIGLQGPGVTAEFELQETQQVTFIFREIPQIKVPENENHMQAKERKAKDPPLTASLVDALLRQTARYWQTWVNQSTYRGRWRESVMRSALTLKLLTYEPTGAVVAAPTFSLPEAIGGSRNWDYRFVWIRDSSFTIYAFLRLGLTEEAQRYMQYISDRCNDLNPDGSLNIMYSIDGVKELDEFELDHLDGYHGSRPVRVGNGAYDHLQLDIYGELLDGVYLYNKYGQPVSYDMWRSIRKLVNYVCDHYNQPDMSIWEVRGQKQNFTYSRVMCWVAIDRGLRLSEKRMFPCRERDRWLNVRDEIYEEIMEKCWNPQLQVFTQGIESPEALDSSVLIMPLVFFVAPNDPRMLSTIRKILLPPEKGGLVANNLVFRYNYLTTDDGVGGLEGAFSMCTFWLVEALTRAGMYDRKLLNRAVVMFEEMVSYGNHLGLFSEEIARSGEMLGNTPQAFSHLSFISAAFNLDRVLSKKN
ncbi:Six-hairpin glycosidase-like protein [Zychaea mexicana]|uniref:Six-hairpin glycosidase-like protein n=1 Tax=Zychaea mexicana TaxID=64656 RepID=UPI0022FDD788|nr:Six-hairpin glycosidase-like protein [Zychaea mexicana]KAI9472872.1 Six-hairpin glycosidase-like protein [Zychaea mexicana]